MRAYEHRRAYEIRVELVDKLGGRCAKCGRKDCLEFNHIYERTWQHYQFNMYQRMLKIRKEVELNLIDLLCRSCNAVYRPRPVTESAVPF